MLILLGVFIVSAAVIVGIALMIIALARREPPVGPGAPTDPGRSAGASADPVEQIRKLAELRDQGLLTEEEFQAKRTELLGRI